MSILASPDKDFPLVSVIMPIRNECGYIQRSLGAVLSQNYPAERVEILVADGMSQDGTREVVAEMIAGRPLARIIDNPGKIVPTGMNGAIRLARGEIIIRIDGHCVVQPEYIKRCVEYLLGEFVDGVGGSLETIGETDIASVIALAMRSPFGVGDSAFRTGQGKTIIADSVPFPAYKMEIIEKVGLYDEELIRNQDDEYNYRIRKIGGNLLLIGDVQSKYYSRSSLSSLWRQYFQYGFWKVRVLQKHPLQMRPRQFIPPGFVLSLIIAVVVGLFLPAGVILFGSIAGLYLLANLAASFWVAAKHGWRHIAFLPVVYGILHFSYGLGFLWGLVRFADRWSDKVGKVPQWLPAD